MNLNTILMRMALVGVAALAGASAWPEPAEAGGPLHPDAAEPRPREQAAHLFALYTKLTASAVFVCGRTPEDFIENDLRPSSAGLLSMLLPLDGLEPEVDTQRKRLILRLPGQEPRTAVYLGSQGCTLLPLGADSVHFEPVAIEPALPEAAEQDWPMGERGAVRVAGGTDTAKLESLLDAALDDSQHTRALVVLHDGHIVAERYAPGFSQDSRHISWSMGKSITAALIGVLAKEGALSVDEPAPIAAWHADPADPRAAITIANLLHMSGGLDFDQGNPLAGTSFTRADNHTRIYFDTINVLDYAVDNDLRHEPGTVWRYLNCDPLSLGRIIRDTVEARGDRYLEFPQRALFDKLGIRNMVLECDPWGNFIMTGFNYGTARDWARFGLLHVNDGVWQGERILPEGWVEFVRSPAPAAEQKQYGAQFWLNAGGRYATLPKDMFWAAGHDGQHCFIIPSRGVVVVRLGHGGASRFEEFIHGVLEALPG